MTVPQTIDEIKRQTTELAEAERIQIQGNGHKPESELITPTPKLPEEAWRGLFAEYRELVAPTTEAPDEFHFGVFTQVMSCTLQRKVWCYHAGEQYPNFYIALIGKSGLSRKDTSVNRGLKLIKWLESENGEKTDAPEFRVVRGLRSFEGLLQELEGADKVRLVILGELLSLMSKSKQEATSNMIPQLTELYDNKDKINPPLAGKGKTIVAERPFLSIIAGSTQQWLKKALTTNDILGGFCNRWCYFTGSAKEPMANPPPMDENRLFNLAESIKAIREWIQGIEDGKLSITPRANDYFNSYYGNYYRRCQVEGLIPTLLARVQDHAWKYATIYAAFDRSPVIDVQHILPALAVAEYLEASIRDVFIDFERSKGQELESRIIEYLKREGPTSKRDLHRNLGVSSTGLLKSAEGLQKLGVIRQFNKKGGQGRRILCYEFVS